MCERVEKGVAGRFQEATTPMRQPGLAGGGCPASQPERLDSVARRVVKGLLRQRIVSDDDHGIVTGLCKSCGEND